MDVHSSAAEWTPGDAEVDVPVQNLIVLQLMFLKY